eukprot:m.168998 g.168998  ORF g.168998 m.168998 type:complete len:64 (+) comp18223_c0_seq2:83-274(+)
MIALARTCVHTYIHKVHSSDDSLGTGVALLQYQGLQQQTIHLKIMTSVKVQHASEAFRTTCLQ